MNAFVVDGLECPEFLEASLAKAGITEPTPVQSEAIPAVLSGRDVLIQSATGTGKTLAYVLPLLQRARADAKFRALILAPSPELAIQILRVVESFAGPSISSASLVGGANPARQKDRLKKHPRFVVGTPGRVIEMIFDERLKVATLGALVLDEADEILSPHNEKNLREIASHRDFHAQLVFASATFGSKATQLAKDWVRPDVIRIAPKAQPLPSQVRHYFMTFEEQRKEVWLARLLEEQHITQALVFVNKLHSVAHLFRFLNDSGVRTVTVSSERGKLDRERALQTFKKGKARVLIATDTAARGLDVPGLEWVIHYDVARDKDIYVHRLGRTGRAGRAGSSVMMVSRREMFLIKRYNEALGIEMEQLDKTSRSRRQREEVDRSGGT